MATKKLTWILLSLGLSLWLVGGVQLDSGLRRCGWSIVPGVVAHSNKISRSTTNIAEEDRFGGSRPATTTTETARVVYRYQVGEETFESDRISVAWPAVYFLMLGAWFVAFAADAAKHLLSIRPKNSRLATPFVLLAAHAAFFLIGTFALTFGVTNGEFLSLILGAMFVVFGLFAARELRRLIVTA